MHREVELNLRHVRSAKLYVEYGGQWILHVWTDLSSADARAFRALEHSLRGLMGRETGYNDLRLWGG